MAAPLTIAVVHAPRVSETHLKDIWENLMSDVGRWGIALTEAVVNPSKSEVDRFYLRAEQIFLILVSGTDIAPDWNELTERYCKPGQVVQLVAVDQSSLGHKSDDFEGWNLRRIARDGVKKKKYYRTKYFLAGYYCNSQIPYGYKKTTFVRNNPDSVKEDLPNGPYVLEQGDPEEVAVVHYIFDAFTYEEKSKMQILLALVAQGVSPPSEMKQWSFRKISTILCDPVYVGANRHVGFLRHDVFPALVSKEQFYIAQARLALKASPCTTFIRSIPEVGALAEEAVQQ